MISPPRPLPPPSPASTTSSPTQPSPSSCPPQISHTQPKFLLNEFLNLHPPAHIHPSRTCIRPAASFSHTPTNIAPTSGPFHSHLTCKYMHPSPSSLLSHLLACIYLTRLHTAHPPNRIPPSIKIPRSTYVPSPRVTSDIHPPTSFGHPPAITPLPTTFVVYTWFSSSYTVPYRLRLVYYP